MKKIVVSLVIIFAAVLLYSFTSSPQEFTSSATSIEIIDDVEVEIHFYEESEFRLVLEETLNGMNESEEKQKILLQKGEEGLYGLSDPIPSNDDDDVERCGDCGPTVDEVMHQLNMDPCWWLVAFTNHVWGWDNGC